MARGYHVESRLILERNSDQVMEWDAVALVPGDELEEVLVEAKSGGWSLPDIFKVVGWTTCTSIERGVLVYRKKKRDGILSNIEQIAGPKGVSAAQFSTREVSKEFAGSFPKKWKSKKCYRNAARTALNYGLRARRLAQRSFVRQVSNNHGIQEFLDAKSYFKLIDESIFASTPVARAIKLCKAWQKTPNVSGPLIDTIGTDRNAEIQNLENKMSNAWVQHCMLMEHTARVRLLKSVVLMHGYSASGTRDKWKPFRILLPQSVRDAVNELDRIDEPCRVPCCLQLFLELFGGWIRNEDDEEWDVLASLSGMSVDDAKRSVQMYDHCFPLTVGTGSWLIHQKNMDRLRMTPCLCLATGSLFRYFLDKHGCKVSRLSDQQWLPDAWYQSMYEYLEPELGD